MEKLEQYLDQVCRGIGGPMEMRRHVRQELREHLLDAIAQHQAAGLSQAEAIDKALAEFGKVEEVRSELEAAHGQRMTWIIDKAMQWKEMTMKAKWLWVTWAYVGIVGVIVLDVLFIWFHAIMIVPKFQKMMADGIVDLGDDDELGVMWIVNFQANVQRACENWATFILLGTIVAIALFEWRVKSENKTFIRFSILGTIAIFLTIVLAVATIGVTILFAVGVPAISRIARPWTLEQVANIERTLGELDQSLAKKERGDKEWEAMQDQTDALAKTMKMLTTRVASSSLTKSHERPSIEEMRTHIKGAQEVLPALSQAVAARDVERTKAELARFRKAFEPVRAAAKQKVP